jgi:hypothetical protein
VPSLRAGHIVEITGFLDPDVHRHFGLPDEFPDEYRFLVQPGIAGTGKRFFKDRMQSPRLKLVSSRTFELGVVLLCYEPERAGER